MRKWNTPEIAALDLNETKNGFWPLDREVSVLVLGGAHDATCHPEQPNTEQPKGNEDTPSDSDNTDYLS